MPLNADTFFLLESEMGHPSPLKGRENPFWSLSRKLTNILFPFPAPAVVKNRIFKTIKVKEP